MELTAPAQRVLGCLVEKALATPGSYPLTRNALRTACNQTTGREPVVDYDDNTVEDALRELREPNLVRTEVVRGSRTPKFSHRLEQELDLDQRAQAILALLLLRGPQTSGELRTRSDRLHPFESLDEVDGVLASLTADGHIERLPRRRGEKAERWRHLLGPAGAGDVPAAPTHSEPTTAPPAEDPPPHTPAPTDELAALRARVTELETIVARLRQRLDDVVGP